MRMSRILALVALMLVALALPGARGMASEGETPVARVYPKYPAAPDKQTEAEAEAKSALRSLWRYNFSPDIGIYRDGMKPVLPQEFSRHLP